MMIGAIMMARRLGNMNKKLLLITLPLALTLSGCSNIKPIPVNHMTEDTLAHNEIFGDIDTASFSKKLTPNKALNEGELYTPLLSFQHKPNNDGTYSVRFIATIESKSMDIVWTRSVHDLNGSTAGGKAKATKQVNTIYESLSDDGVQVWATNVVEKDDELGTKPFNYYAVYCLLNIPNSVSNYYIDAFVTVTLGESSKNSYVGSVNVADKTKHIKYSLEGGDRYVADINGVVRESDPHDGNNLMLNSIDLSVNDKLQAYYLDTNALTYTRYGYADLVRNNPDFEAGSSGEIKAKYSSTYNVFLNTSNQFSFEKKIYFQGPSWWANNSAAPIIDLKHASTGEGDSDQYKTFTMLYNNVPNQHYAFADISYYTIVQFYRAESGGNFNHTGWMFFPTTGENMYTRGEGGKAGAWSIYGGEAPIIEETNFTFDEIALATPQKIHTTDQDNYLKFTGDYYHITDSDLSSFNANGNADNSKPLDVTVNWNYDVPSGKTVSNYTFMYGQESDLSDAYTVSTTTEKTVSISNAYLGDNYFRVVANLSDGTHESSPIKVFKVETQAPRNLSVGNMPNCRDMGGRTTYAGGKIKQGLIYRTAGNKFDKQTQVDDTCMNVLRNQLKVKTEINVSDGIGNNVNLGGSVNLVNAYMDYGSTPYSNLSRNAERIRYVMDTLSNPDNYPVFYHCRIGTDRTGITGMMIGGLIGIPFNEIMQDYCFSNFAPIDGKRYPNKPSDPNGDDCAKYVDEILAMPGETYQEQTYNALLSIGIPASTLNAIINIVTEGTKAEISAIGKIGVGDSLSSTGTRKTDNEYKNPAIYYQLSNGNSVSFTTELTSGRKSIVAYLGCQDSSSSTKLASCISLKIDGVEQSIVDKTLFKAGFGKTSQNSRTGYMFNILRDYSFATGQHTITITSKTNTTFYIGTICVFDISANAPHTSHFYEQQDSVTNKAGKQVDVYSCYCGKKYMGIDFLNGYSSLSGNLNDGTTGKLTNGTIVKYDFPATTGSVQLQFALKMSSSSHGSQSFNTSKYSIKINGISTSLSITNGISYSNLGLTNTSFAYVTFCSFNIESDANIEVELDHNNDSYRLLFGDQVRLMYEE